MVHVNQQYQTLIMLARTCRVLELRNFLRPSWCRFASRAAKKKKEKASPKITFGKVGHSLKCGIVGVPNVGKSSFFNLLTNGKAAAANYPFCTIDPNQGRVAVPDKRFERLCTLYKPEKCTPASMNVTDIAGLVKGANEGAGLGNSFLSHIGSVDAIYHLCRGFDSDSVSHVEGTIDPGRDLEIIAQELRLKDLAYAEKAIERTKSASRSNANKQVEIDTLQKARSLLATGEHDIRNGDWSEGEVMLLNPHFFLTAKPAMYVMNVSKEEYLSGKYKYLSEAQEFVNSVDSNTSVIPFSVEYEQELVDGVEEELKESAVPSVTQEGFKQLRLISFFTVGPDEVRAWPIHESFLAPQAAGRIHTDFEKTFIQAEVVLYDDLMACGSEEAAKTAGKLKKYGKEYLVQDGDVIHFRVAIRRK